MHVACLKYGWPYNPKGDYFSFAKRHLDDACHLCFKKIKRREMDVLGGMCLDKGTLRALGVRVCSLCFFEHTVSKFFYYPRM